MRLRITNFQSIKSADLSVEGLTVLVGRSNIGKSAVLRAVQAVLFNRPGEDFVRWGEKKAEVQVEDLPGVGTVRWEKGSGANRFTINDEVYAKVGAGTPPQLAAAGYRDIEAGSDTLRPLAQSQFEPIFLLNRPGSLVAEVLTALSRIKVVQTAERQCATDLASAKKTLKIREKDLADAEAAFTTWDDLPALAARAEALKAHGRTLDQMSTNVAVARELVFQRARLAAVAGLAAPPPVPVEAPALTARVQQFVHGRSLVKVQQAYTPVAQLEMPPRVRAEVPAEAARVRAAAPLVTRRLTVAAVAQLRVPPALTVVLDPLYEKSKLVEQGWASVNRLGTARHTLFDRQASYRALVADGEHAQAELDQLLSEVTLCPTCQRPL